MDDNETSPLDSFQRRQLNELEELTVHRELMVAAAMDFCAEENIDPPSWLVKEAAALLCELLKREKTEKRGRAAGKIARYRQDMWDVERWDAVEEMRRIRNHVQHDLEIMREYGDLFKGSAKWRNAERLLAWFRHGIFECASMYLTGRDARS